MTNQVISNLLMDSPMQDISINVDFEKTVSYMLQYSGINMDTITNNHPSHYPASHILLRKVRLLFQNKELTWVEAAASFEELHGECLVKDGKEASGAWGIALKTYRWISEESDYLQTVYQKNVNQKREEIYSQMENLERKQDAYVCITEHKTETLLSGILYRLKISHSLRYPDKEIHKMLYTLSYDTTIFSRALPLIINTIYELLINNLAGNDILQTLYTLISEKVTIHEKKVAQFWYADEWSELHPLITEAIQQQALLFLLLEKMEDKENDQPVIAARICRYLSRLPSAYSELLKNKSYTLLTGENKLNGRIQWDRLCNFDETQFLEQIITIQADAQLYPACEQDNKWKQCSNATNTLTLDNEGFTLSPLFPHANQSWKGRKDRATVLQNRLFLTTFTKLTCTFDSCRNIKDFRLYWKQLTEDYPMSPQWNDPVKKNVFPEEKEIEETDILPPSIDTIFPLPDQDLKIRILCIDEENMSMQAEITNGSSKGMKAHLPFAHINSCYSIIPGFTSLFSPNEIFKAKVKDTDKGGITLSLIKDYNEFIYPECVRRKSLTGQVVEIRDGKVQWLLSSGATATTAITPHKKYRIGDIYKVEYASLLPGKLKNNINIQSHVAHPDKKEFYCTVLDNIRDFFLFLTKEALKVKDNQTELPVQKKEHNPFFVALQSLNLSDTDESTGETIIPTEPKTIEEKESEKKLTPPNSSLNIKQVQELIYCMDSLISDIEDPCEQFNTYNMLHFLCNFAGNKELANYYLLCADYIYNVDVLTTEPFQDRFSKEGTQKFSDLLIRMESLGLQQYSRTFGLCKQVIQVLEALFDTHSLTLLQAFMQSQNQTVAELARYFSITRYLKDNDVLLQQLIYKNINILLGFKEPTKKTKSYLPVYFGHEGVEKEFKTSAFIHADKNAAEEQCVVLARVIASFMNTDGGTLYIGVNDLGYLTGLTQEFKHTHNDSDVYLRTVNRDVIRQLGEAEDWNRYQEYIRCRLYEYEDSRMVLAFRVSPINEVVKVKGVVYTRSGSCNTVKPVENVNEFIRKRREQKLNSIPRKPEFPLFFSTERNEYIFCTISHQSLSSDLNDACALEDRKNEKVKSTVVTFPVSKESVGPEKESIKTTLNIKTSSLRNNPLQKKTEHGYTPNHLFVSIFANGKIAYSASPKIGIWGDKGKVVFSYSPEEKEDLMVAIFINGEVGVSNLKKGMSQPNTLLAFVNSVNNLFFLSPAHKTDYLLLISEKDKEKRYRIISLKDFEKSMSIQPKNTLILEPDKGIFIFAEILSSEQIHTLNDDKISLTDFDQYNAGRCWEHSVYRQDVSTISTLCGITY